MTRYQFRLTYDRAIGEANPATTTETYACNARTIGSAFRKAADFAARTALSGWTLRSIVFTNEGWNPE